MAKKKILIVDDESDFVEMVTMRLHASGFDVVTAYDGEAALRAVEAERPDLILLDIMLPKIEGRRIRSLLLRNPATARIPVILLTAKALTLDEAGDGTAPPDPLIRKPFDPQTLLGTIRDLLAKTGAAPS